MTFLLSDLGRYWTTVNGAVIVITLLALVDALRDRSAVRVMNGHATHIAASGNVRRESIRLATQVMLVVFGWASTQGADRIVTLTPGLLALLVTPALILLNTIGDAYDRIRLERYLRAQLEAERLGRRDRNRRHSDPK